MSDDCNIKVICRFRPINNREKQEAIAAKEDPERTIVRFIDEQTCEIIQNIQGNQKFVFDRVFQMNCRQPDVYDATARKTIEDVINGFNGTIFAYGQTGAGKSFSMFGGDDPANEVTRGIIPRASSHIFAHIMEDKSDTEYTIKVSFLEIYNEKIRDLLNTEKDNLQVRQSPARGIYVDGATEEFVNCEANIYELLKRGEENRTVQATLMNAVSSRSHSIFIVMVQQKDPEGSTKTGKLNLVDLAGSEKISKTGVMGTALEEAKNINRSLSALGNCIHALTDKSIKHIPYRDSKLTRMLQESLGGNCKTTLLIACSPHPFNVDETISTCKFGQRAKSIKNRVKQNAQKSVAELMAIIAKLQQQLAMWKSYSENLEKALAWYKENHGDDECPIEIPSKPTLAALMNSKKSSGGSGGSGGGSGGGSEGSGDGSGSGSGGGNKSDSSDADGTDSEGLDNIDDENPLSADAGGSKGSKGGSSSEGNGLGFQLDEALDDPLVMLTTLKTQLERTEKAKEMMKDSYEDEINDMKQTIREQYQDITGMKEKLQELGVDTSAFGCRTLNDSWLTTTDDEVITRAMRNSATRESELSPTGFSMSNPQWEEEKAQLEENMITITNQLEEARTANVELEAKLAEAEKAMREKEALEKQMKDYEDLATLATTEKEELEKALEEREAETATIQEEYDNQIETITKENTEMQQMIVTLDDELEHTKGELETQLEIVQTKTAELEDFKELATSLEQQISQYDAEIEELQNNLDIMTRSRDEALKDKGELRETTQKVDALQTELSHEKSRADQMTIKCTSMEKVIEAMKAEMATLKASQETQRKELRDKDLEIKKYIQATEAEQMKNEALQTKLDAATTNVSAIKEELAQKTNVEKELRMKFDKLAIEAKNLSDASKRTEALEEQLKASETERKKLAEEAKRATTEAEARTREIVVLRTKQNTGSERIHALNTQIKTLKSDVCKCNEKIVGYERQMILMQSMFEEEKKEILAKYSQGTGGARIARSIIPSTLRNQAGVRLDESK